MSLLKVDKSDSNSYITRIISEHNLNYLFILTQMVILLKQSKHEYCLRIIKDKLKIYRSNLFNSLKFLGWKPEKKYNIFLNSRNRCLEICALLKIEENFEVENAKKTVRSLPVIRTSEGIVG